MKWANSNRETRRAFTLMELMVVIVLIGIVSAAMIPEMKGTYEDALLRSTSRELLNTFDLAYSRAVSLNRTHRVRLEPSTGKYVVERQITASGMETFAPLQDVIGGEGTLDSRIAIELHTPDQDVASRNSSQGSEPPVPEAISFYPDGTADAAEILLRDRAGFRLLLRLNPTTARVEIVEMERE